MRRPVGAKYEDRYTNQTMKHVLQASWFGEQCLLMYSCSVFFPARLLCLIFIIEQGITTKQKKIGFRPVTDVNQINKKDLFMKRFEATLPWYGSQFI